MLPGMLLHVVPAPGGVDFLADLHAGFEVLIGLADRPEAVSLDASDLQCLTRPRLGILSVQKLQISVVRRLAATYMAISLRIQGGVFMIGT